MRCTDDQLAEILELIKSIHSSMIATQTKIEAMISELSEMRRSADRINGQMIPNMIDMDAPSICPALTS